MWSEWLNSNIACQCVKNVHIRSFSCPQFPALDWKHRVTMPKVQSYKSKYKVAIPFLNCVEKCDQNGLIQILPVTVWKVSTLGVFLVCSFPHSDTDRYSVSLRIQSKCGKMHTTNTPNTPTFYAVCIVQIPVEKKKEHLERVQDWIVTHSNRQTIFINRTWEAFIAWTVQRICRRCKNTIWARILPRRQTRPKSCKITHKNINTENLATVRY